MSEYEDLLYHERRARQARSGQTLGDTLRSCRKFKVSGCRNCLFLGSGHGHNSAHKHCNHPDARRVDVDDAVHHGVVASGCPLFASPIVLGIDHGAALYRWDDIPEGAT